MVDGGLVDLNRADSRLPYCIKDLLAEGMMGLMRLWPACRQTGPAHGGHQAAARRAQSGEVALCGAELYADHAKESGVAPPAEPVFF